MNLSPFVYVFSTAIYLPFSWWCLVRVLSSCLGAIMMTTCDHKKEWAWTIRKECVVDSSLLYICHLSSSSRAAVFYFICSITFPSSRRSRSIFYLLYYYRLQLYWLFLFCCLCSVNDVFILWSSTVQWIVVVALPACQPACLRACQAQSFWDMKHVRTEKTPYLCRTFLLLFVAVEREGNIDLLWTGRRDRRQGKATPLRPPWTIG